jgi:hypothetical protein
MNAVSATPPPSEKRDQQHSMRSPLVVSLLFHVFLLLLFSGAFFFFSKPIEIPEEPMSVEILPVAEKASSTINAPVAKQMPKEPQEVADTPPPMAKSTAQQAVKPEPPKPAEKVKAEKMEEIKPQDTPPPPLKKAELAEKKAAPKPAPKAPAKKPQEAKKEETKEKPVEENTQEFSSVLKNLVGDEAPPTPDSRPVDTPRQAPQLTAPAPLGSTMSMSEMDALRQQLAGCWNVIAGAADAQNLSVDIQVMVNSDRTVASARIVDQGRYGSDALYRAAADSAMRALRAPGCTPLALPEGKYDQWKSMTINFDPKTMFGA